ncbi:ASCH domain-containing protein [Candidatus Vondammii sp. HM_W22]|uniref:ASCH domain-containing protein n=1 Tax=Candidatus Vondammii sp. HM_W22 TaxID=2687299 RepID=UPI001F137230|nr:ASCH domain-containing protein [Candidatus Vondammii sp. HM_W22]
MPALNFKKQFAPGVRDHSKRQTIRVMRKHPIRTGDTLYLYTGMRTSGCEKLGEAAAKTVTTIYIDSDVVNVDCETLHPYQVAELARADGFAGIAEFKAFFRDTHGLPFTGQLIKW